MINKKLLAKSMLVWLGILPLAILNGALRDYALAPLISENVAMPISGILLSIMIFFLAFIFLPLLGKGTTKTYIVMGVIWTVATVILEFIIGFITQVPMTKMLNAYNFLTGNLWSLVLIIVIFTPLIVAKIRKIIVKE